MLLLRLSITRDSDISSPTMMMHQNEKLHIVRMDEVGRLLRNCPYPAVFLASVRRR